MYLTDAAGREHILRLATPGSLLGTCGLGRSPKYCYGVRASAPRTSTCFVSLDTYETLQRDRPEVIGLLTAHLVDDLSDTYARLHRLATRTARVRLAEALLELSRGSGSASGRLLTVPRSQLAQMVGVSTETSVRVLGQLKKEGLIGTRGRSIQILDPRGLSDLLDA